MRGDDVTRAEAVPPQGRLSTVACADLHLKSANTPSPRFQKLTRQKGTHVARALPHNLPSSRHNLAVAPADEEIPPLAVGVSRDVDKTSLSRPDLLAKAKELRGGLSGGGREGRGGEEEGGGVEVHG